MAENSRTRLSVVPGNKLTSPSALSYLDERAHGRRVRDHVRDFGALFALIALGFAGYFAWHDRGFVSYGPLLGLAALLYSAGRAFPQLLHPFWRAWMGLAKILNAVVTPVLLSIVWFVCVIPIAMIMRIAGVKRLDLAFQTGRVTYWQSRPRDAQDFKLMTRQY